ncbi:hypothetical protein ES708_10392 [subsurface metagenome]
MGITDPNERYFKDGSWGWDGTQWRPSGLLSGYTENLCIRTQEIHAAAGNVNLDVEAVPGGELWVVTSLFAMNSVSNVTKVLVSIVYEDVPYYLATCGALAEWVGFTWNGNVYLPEGYFIRARFYGCTAEDDIEIAVHGYKLTVT